MSSLDQAVRTIEGWGSARSKDRTRCIRLLKQSARHMERAIAVWQKFLDNAPETGDRFTPVLWMGAKPAKKLHALYLENKETLVALSELTGVRLKGSLSLAEDLDVVQPYDQLKPGETGAARAEVAIAEMRDRKKRIESAVETLGG